MRLWVSLLVYILGVSLAYGGMLGQSRDSNYNLAAGSGGSGPALAFVQVGPSCTPTGTTGGASPTCTFGSATGVGDAVIVAIGWNDGTSVVTSVTDSQGDCGSGFAVAGSPGTGNGLSQAIYYCLNIHGGADTVTVHFSVPPNYPDIMMAEYAGVLGFDVAGAIGTAASGTTATGGSYTTNYANELLIGTGTTGAGGFNAPGSGYASRLISSPDGDILEDQIVSSTGTYTPTASLVSGTWIFQGAAFHGNPSGGSGSVAFTALHTYFISSSGNDSTGNGTQGNPYATPNHATVCGDVWIGLNGTYSSNGINITQTPSNCPSTSGGIDGTGGIYFAVLLCQTPFACIVNLNSGTTYGPAAVEISGSNWAVEGWNTSATGTVSGGAQNGGYCFGPNETNNHAVYIAFINNFAHDCGRAYSTINNNGSDGADYEAYVGNFSWRGNRVHPYDSGAFITGAEQPITPGADSSGIHSITNGNFALYNTLLATEPGNTDMEAYNFDSMNIFPGTVGKVVYKNNVAVATSWAGFMMTVTGSPNNGSNYDLELTQNTFYGNMRCTAWNPGTTGEITWGSWSTVTMTVNIYNNIAQTNTAVAGNYDSLGCSGSGNDALAYYAIGPDSPGTVTVGGSGQQNIFFSGLLSSCPTNNCDGGYNAGYVTGASGGLGTNTYTNPSFTNTPDLINNHLGLPTCLGFTDIAACMGWSYGTQTASSLSVIADLTPTAGGVSGKGYQPPRACAPDPLWPSWLKGIVYLAWDGANLTEQPGLVNKPCLM